MCEILDQDHPEPVGQLADAIHLRLGAAEVVDHHKDPELAGPCEFGHLVEVDGEVVP